MRHGAATGLREIIKVHGQGAGKTLDASQSLEEVCKTILQWDLNFWSKKILYNYKMISNSNWTKWSNFKSASRSADLKLRAQLLPELYDTKSNY